MNRSQTVKQLCCKKYQKKTQKETTQVHNRRFLDDEPAVKRKRTNTLWKDIQITFSSCYNDLFQKMATSLTKSARYFYCKMTQTSLFAP